MTCREHLPCPRDACGKRVPFVSARHEERIRRRARRICRVASDPACTKEPRSQGDLAPTDSADMRSSTDSLLISHGHLLGPTASTPRPAKIISLIIRRNHGPSGGRGWASASIKKCGAVPGRYRLEGWRLIWASNIQEHPREHSGTESSVCCSITQSRPVRQLVSIQPSERN